MTTPAPGTPFRRTLGTGEFAGRVLRDSVHEGFLEVLAQPTVGEHAIDPSDASPPPLAESALEAAPPAPS
jgi:hypothetical protein